jgi:hypothetical protein
LNPWLPPCEYVEAYRCAELRLGRSLPTVRRKVDLMETPYQRAACAPRRRRFRFSEKSPAGYSESSPYPYQRSTAERCAIPHSPRSYGSEGAQEWGELQRLASRPDGWRRADER